LSGVPAEGGVEERLVGLAEAADVDDDGLLAGESEFAEAEAETPGGVVVEVGEVEFGFLTGDDGEVPSAIAMVNDASVEEGIKRPERSVWAEGRTPCEVPSDDCARRALKECLAEKVPQRLKPHCKRDTSARLKPCP